MAIYTVSFAKHATLAVSTVDVVNITSNESDEVVVYNRGATGDIYFTKDGTVPTVAGDDTFVAGPGRAVSIESMSDTDQIKLISASANAYSVMGGDDVDVSGT